MQQPSEQTSCLIGESGASFNSRITETLNEIKILEHKVQRFHKACASVSNRPIDRQNLVDAQLELFTLKMTLVSK